MKNMDIKTELAAIMVSYYEAILRKQFTQEIMIKSREVQWNSAGVMNISWLRSVLPLNFKLCEPVNCV